MPSASQDTFDDGPGYRDCACGFARVFGAPGIWPSFPAHHGVKKCNACSRCGHGTPGHGGRRCTALVNTADCGPMGPAEPDECGCKGVAV